MAKSQKRSSREAKKEKKPDATPHKGPKYLESAALSASSKVVVPKKGGSGKA